jgi:hypothetical protein
MVPGKRIGNSRAYRHPTNGTFHVRSNQHQLFGLNLFFSVSCVFFYFLLYGHMEPASSSYALVQLLHAGFILYKI